jgi:protein-disulfide isomerase
MAGSPVQKGTIMTSIGRAILPLLLLALGTTALAAPAKLFPDDRSLGSAKAPVQIIEYAAPVCPHCAKFSQTVLPQIQKTYIDTGKVHYVLRIFPLSPYDGAIAGMAACLPPKRYFEFLALAFAKQTLWLPASDDATAGRAGLVSLGALAGLKPDQVDKCIADDKEIARVNRIAEDGQNTYHVHGVPTLIIDGTEVPDHDWPQLQARIDGLLASAREKR